MAQGADLGCESPRVVSVTGQPWVTDWMCCQLLGSTQLLMVILCLISLGWWILGVGIPNRSVSGLASGLTLSCLSCALQKMVESQRQNVLGEFERLRRLLAEEEQQLLQKLEEEELEVLPRLREGATRLGQQSSQLAALISDLENRCQLPALGLLQVSGLGRMSWRSTVLPRGTSGPHPSPHC